MAASEPAPFTAQVGRVTSAGGRFGTATFGTAVFGSGVPIFVAASR